MRRRSKSILGLLAVIVLVGMAGFIAAVRHGFSTHDEPMALEALMAGRMRRWATPSDLRSRKNPMPLTPEVLADGRAHFADHCAICHGNDGKGKTDMGQHLYPRAPDLTLAGAQTLSDGEIFATIENGVRLTGMPGFGNGTAASAAGTWQLVHFIHHLPKITAEELAEMEKLNPKSPEEWQQMQQEAAFLAGGDAQTHHH
jgi:mono/diheme cytochrome c family protein